MDEPRIEQLAKTLGADAAERVDPDRVAHAVLHRLRDEPVVRVVWWRRTAAWRVAAVLVLFVAGAFAVRSVTGGGGDEAGVEAVFPYAMEDLSVPELNEVLDSLYVEAPVHEITAASLYDLNEAQLALLLEALEG